MVKFTHYIFFTYHIAILAKIIIMIV